MDPIRARTLKLVYWGPGRSGKTTNLLWLHSKLRPELRGRLITLDSPGERTIYFDCLPLEMNPAGGSPIRLRLYTVPGQPRFRITRRIVLEGVDGIVFVWDSRARRLRADIESLCELKQTLEDTGRVWAELPHVLQLNKQDLDERVPRERLDDVLDRLGETVPRVPAVASAGSGVLDTLGAVARAALRSRRTQAVGTGTMAAPASGTPC